MLLIFVMGGRWSGVEKWNDFVLASIVIPKVGCSTSLKIRPLPRVGPFLLLLICIHLKGSLYISSSYFAQSVSRIQHNGKTALNTKPRLSREFT